MLLLVEFFAELNASCMQLLFDATVGEKILFDECYHFVEHCYRLMYKSQHEIAVLFIVQFGNERVIERCIVVSSAYV